MIATLFTTLLALAPAAPVRAFSDGPGNGATGVRIILNRDEFRTGDPVRVQVETGEDGYLIVMRVDGDGRIRVIFPLDPGLDPFVRGGKRYELRGREEKETFTADNLGGAGIVFAALSKDPLSFRDYATGGHWDYEALRVTELRNDPEAELHRFVRAMSDDGKYAFDVKGYRVVAVADASEYYATTATPVYVGGYDPYRCIGGPRFGARSGLRIGVSIGAGYNTWDPWDPWYDPFWSTSYSCGNYWDPYFASSYSPWYSPYYPGQYAPYSVINYRPRPVPNFHEGERARPRPSIIAPRIGTVATGVRPEAQTRPPQAAGERARPRPSAPPPATPPAQETRPARDPQQAPARTVQQGSAGTSGSSSSGRARPRGDQTATRTGDPVGAGSVPVTTVPTPPSVQRLDGPRPVFRDPVTEPPTGGRDRRVLPTEQRPVYREPDRTVPTARTPVPVSEPKKAEEEPRRGEARPEQPRERKPDPAPPSRTAPPPAQAPRASSPPPPPPPPPPPATSGGTRSRARVGGG